MHTVLHSCVYIKCILSYSWLLRFISIFLCLLILWLHDGSICINAFIAYAHLRIAIYNLLTFLLCCKCKLYLILNDIIFNDNYHRSARRQLAKQLLSLEYSLQFSTYQAYVVSMAMILGRILWLFFDRELISRDDGKSRHNRINVYLYFVHDGVECHPKAQLQYIIFHEYMIIINYRLKCLHMNMFVIL